MAAITTVSAASSRQRRSKFFSMPSRDASSAGTQVRLQAQHQHLVFRIAEAHVVLDQLRSAVADHQPGEQHALVRRAHRLHRPHRRQHDLVHGAPDHLRRHHRRRRIGAHAAGVGALVAVEDALVVLRGDERDRGLAVAQREERRLLAAQEFLDHDLGARLAETAAEHHVDGGFGLGQRLRHDHALAGGEPVGLDDDRRALLAHIGLGGRGGGEALIGGGRDVVRPAQVLGEALGAFELRRRLARPERLDAGGGEIVDDAGARAAPRARPRRGRCRCARQNAITAAWSAGSSATSSHSCAMPALPGAQ